MPSTNVAASRVTQGTVEYKSTIPRSMIEGLDLWEAIVERTLCDLEKAFYHILLSKLNYCRITGKSYAWNKSYFGNRYKRLMIKIFQS